MWCKCLEVIGQELCLPSAVLLSFASFVQPPFTFRIKWKWSWITFEIIHSLLEPGQSPLCSVIRTENSDLVPSCTAFSIHRAAPTKSIVRILTGHSSSFRYGKNGSLSCSETQCCQWGFKSHTSTFFSKFTPLRNTHTHSHTHTHRNSSKI